jgi:hypothetical protein
MNPAVQAEHFHSAAFILKIIRSTSTYTENRAQGPCEELKESSSRRSFARHQ